MNPCRRNAVCAGILLVVATVANVLGNAITNRLLADPIDLARVAATEPEMFAGVLLQLIAAAACPGIALALYPVLRRYSDGFALGSVAFRVIEGTFLVASAIGLLVVVSLSEQAGRSGAADSVYFRESAALLVAGTDWLGFAASVPFFGIGALLYYQVLYRSALIPRWLSAWGLVAAALAIVASVLALLHVTTPLSAPHIALNLPIAAQEMVLAAWLIARGFDPRAVAALPAGAPSFAGAPAV